MPRNQDKTPGTSTGKIAAQMALSIAAAFLAGIAYEAGARTGRQADLEKARQRVEDARQRIGYGFGRMPYTSVLSARYAMLRRQRQAGRHAAC